MKTTNKFLTASIVATIGLGPLSACQSEVKGPVISTEATCGARHNRLNITIDESDTIKRVYCG